MRVFICYSHKDKEYFEFVNKHLSINKKDLDVWSDEKIEGGDNWRDEIQKALDSCNLAILIISANFFDSDFIQDVELKQLLENEFEKGTILLAILAEDCDIEAFSWIDDIQILPSKDLPLENVKNKLKSREGKKISKRVRELINSIPDSPEIEDNITSYNYPDAIEENNFPTSNDDFFGREKYFDILDKAWGDEQVNILSFIAFGGIGKTSLIDNWLKKMKEMHYKGAKNIFMWSFYSQGSEEDRQVTATEFLLEACKFFKIKKIPKTAYEQGRELADVISKQRALLVLDGLEPLQSSLEDMGEIKDNGLQVLLKRLSRQNKGLVVITSRIKLASIDNQSEELEKLEDYEGAELLKSFELNGTQKELENISNDFDGHALALKLLGSYTKTVLDKNINRINEIEALTEDQSKSSRHAIRMLNSYKKYLEREGKVELDILKLLGFFDRAISFDVIDVLKNKPLIDDINDKLINISEIDWKYVLNNLKELHLLSNYDKVLDTHPLVREYFSKDIEENYSDSYIKSHHRLYVYYEKLPEKEFPDTVEEMEPLFQAIYHGCKAKEYLNTFIMYTIRINRKKVHNVETFYLSYTLGEIYLELKVISNYFKKPFIEFVENLDSRIKSSAIGIVVYNHILLGKYKKALNLIDLESSINVSNDAIIQSSTNHCLLYLFLGDLNNAEKVLKKNIPLTFNIYDYGLEGSLLADYAYVNFLMGKFEDAKKHFKEAEDSYVAGHRKNSVPINYLASVMGYRYIKYLIYIKTDPYKLIHRLNETMKLSSLSKYITDLGLEYILMARIKFIINSRERIVLSLVEEGIKLLRKSNDDGYTIEVLIESANIYKEYLIFEKSNECLDEAYEYIMRSKAKLLLADWYIVAIKLSLDEKNFIKANTYLKEAKDLSKELNEYFIFKEELKKLAPHFDMEVRNNAM